MSTRSERLEYILENNNQITSLQVVFVDIVKYSARPPASQRDVIARFMACLKAALKDPGSLSDELGALVHRTPDFDAAIIKLPTGDGAAIAFPFDAVADLHLLFAKRLLEEVYKSNQQTSCLTFETEQWCDCHPNFDLRVGVSAGGESIIYRDVNENYNVAGSVINLAARVMDLADGGQIIFTDKAHEKLTGLKPALKPHFRELERLRVKSDFIQAYQYVGGNEPYINRRPPTEVYLRGFPTKADLREIIEQSVEAIRHHLDAGLGDVLSQTEGGFERLGRMLSSSLSARSLKGRKDIYEAVSQVIREARDHIRIVRLGSRAAESNIINALADRINDGVEYEVVILLDQHDASRGFMRNHRRLLMLIDEGKAPNYRAHLLRADRPICFDVLIVDDKYVGLGFTRLGATGDLEAALLLQDANNKIAQNFTEWFDRVIMPRAEKIVLRRARRPPSLPPA